MTESTKGVIALIVACTAWGLSALYYGQLRHVPPPSAGASAKPN